jgi:hypothetical protein
MPREQRSPMGGQANFYINNCSDLRSFPPLRMTGAPSGDQPILAITGSFILLSNFACRQPVLIQLLWDF